MESELKKIKRLLVLNNFELVKENKASVEYRKNNLTLCFMLQSEESCASIKGVYEPIFFPINYFAALGILFQFEESDYESPIKVLTDY